MRLVASAPLVAPVIVRLLPHTQGLAGRTLWVPYSRAAQAYTGLAGYVQNTGGRIVGWTTRRGQTIPALLSDAKLIGVRAMPWLGRMHGTEPIP